MCELHNSVWQPEVCACWKWCSILLQNDDSLLFPILIFELLFGTSLHLLWFCYLPFLSLFFFSKSYNHTQFCTFKISFLSFFLLHHQYETSSREKLPFCLYSSCTMTFHFCEVHTELSFPALLRPLFNHTLCWQLEEPEGRIFRCKLPAWVTVEFIKVPLGCKHIYLYIGINPKTIKCNKPWISDIIVLYVTS